MSTSSPFPYHPREGERVLSLAGLHLEGRDSPAGLGRICDLARQLFGVPMSTVSFLDAESQWLKASSSEAPMTACTPRGDSICSHTILGEDILVVEDATLDPRFRDSPLVSVEGGIRFYAGVPIMVDTGLPLGAFCILDTVPRTFGEIEARQLTTLADMASNELRLHRAALDLDAAERRFRALVDASVTMAWQMNHNGDIVHISTKHAYAGADPSHYLGKAYLGQIHPEDLSASVAALSDAMAGGKSGEWVIRVRTPANAYRWLQVKCMPVLGHDGSIEEWMGSCSDIHDRKLAEDAAWHAATHDPLTGLTNRNLFHKRLGEALEASKSKGTQAHLLMVDLDNFKDINDTLGHDSGDALLRHVASELLAAVGPGDTVARFGGDEFGIILPDAPTPEAAMAVAQRMLRGIERPVSHGHRPLSCHASIGISTYPIDGTTSTDLFKAADMAMYAAKGSGRNRAACFDASLREETEERVRIAGEIKDAIQDGLLVPYYQPKVCLVTGRLSGFEALVRWNHPTRGLLAPGSFASALEDPALSLMIGDRMVQSVLSDLGDWIGQGLDVGRVAVNFSSSQFARPDLAAGLVKELALHRVPASCLEVEVTETVFLSRSSTNVARTLSELDEAGISIALDDFGTGFASLTHLKQFPVHRIKIDRSFVSDIERVPEDAAIVAAVTGLARNLGMTVVAEGVESDGQATYLRSKGCHEAQGYLYAKPMPAGAMPRFIKGWTPRATAEGASLPRLISIAS